MFVLFAVVLAFFVPVAQAAAPQLVRLTGVLSRAGEKGVEQGANTFTVYAPTPCTGWIFDVKMAQEGGKFDWEVLRNVFPPRLYFLGAENLITFLEQPEMAGKLITVEGYFHSVPENIFEVTAIRNVAE